MLVWCQPLLSLAVGLFDGIRDLVLPRYKEVPVPAGHRRRSRAGATP